MVVFCLICSCLKLYVGQISQELRKRVQKHFSTITLADRDLKSRKKITLVAEHFLKFHNGQCTDLQVMGIDKISTNIRGGEFPNTHGAQIGTPIYRFLGSVFNKKKKYIYFYSAFYLPYDSIAIYFVLLLSLIRRVS